MWFTRTSKIETDRRAVLVWLSLFAVAPVSRVSALRFSGLPRRASNPKTVHPHLPCPQAPLQSLTTAVSLSTPVPALPSADPFESAPSRGCERLPATRWPDAGEPTKDRYRPEGRNLSLQRPFDPDGGDLRRSCTSRVSMGGGRGTNPKVCTGPPRAKALGRNREKSLPSPLESEWQATVDQRGNPRCRACQRQHARP